MGRSDIVVSVDRYIYIIEFKMGSAQSALDQIEAKQYYAPYLGKNKKIILLDIGLSENERNITDWKSKELCDLDETGEIGGETKPGIAKKAKATDEIEESKREEKRRMATLMLSKNYPVEEIILFSGLSEEEIKGL